MNSIATELISAQRYSPLIHRLNAHIESFNVCLADGHKLKKVGVDDRSTFAEIVGCAWSEQHWPSKDNAGVYVLCGRHESDISRIGAYIGKASLKNIGHRVWSHFRPYREVGTYRFGRDLSECFVVEAVLAVPILPPTPRAMASALEEHILANGLDDIRLFNKVGAIRCVNGPVQTQR